MTTIEKHDRVMMAAKFLRNTGQHYGDPAPTSSGPFARGEVIHIDPEPLREGGPQYCRVAWDDGITTGVLTCNIERAQA